MNTPKLRFALATCLAGCSLFSTGRADALSKNQAHYYSQRYVMFVSRFFGVSLGHEALRAVHTDVVNGGDGTAPLMQVVSRTGVGGDKQSTCELLIKSRMLAESATLNTEFDDTAFEAYVLSACGG